MKNPPKNNRSLISKITARVMLIILVLTSALSFGACGEPNCEEGQYYNSTALIELSLSLKAISDIDEFPSNDVTFDICIGLNRRMLRNFYTIDEYETPTWPYYSDNWYYVLYVVHALDFDNWTENVDYNDYNSQENIDESFLNQAYVLKEIPHREAVESREYYFIDTWEGEYFNHCEKITIPKEVFLDDVSERDKYIYIGIAQVEKSSETEEYRSSPYNYVWVTFRYSMIDDNSIYLWFPHVNN